MIKLAAGWTLAIALALAAVSSARGQEPNVQIVQLECSGDPELVVIQNLGDAAQEFAGWQLQSEPASSEAFELTALGGLQPGGSVSIQSGPSASGVFKWGLEFVFRDNDPTDYARIVDDTGAVVHQVNCSSEAAPSPTPTPSLQPSPTPTSSPQPSPAADVPNGGGAPPPSGDLLSAAMMVLVGGSMAAAGVATSALSWLRLRSSSVAGTTAALESREAVADPHVRPGGSESHRGEPSSAAVRLALVCLLAAALAFLFLRRVPQ